MSAPASAGAAPNPHDSQPLNGPQQLAVRLRLAGQPYRAIGAALGVSHTCAAALVRAAVAAPRGGPDEELRLRELAEVDSRLRSLRRRRRELATAGGDSL